MILFQTQSDKLPTRSAAGRQGRTHTAACVASVVLVACMLSACASRLQSGPVTSAAALYPDLNDPPPSVAMREDDAAHIKAGLIQLRDDQERAAAEQQSAVMSISPPWAGDEESLADGAD
jgi:hypothetical protein